MLTRILSAIVGIPLAIFILYKGGLLLTAAVAAVTLIGINEFYSVFKKLQIYPFKIVGSFASAAIVIFAGIYKGTAQLIYTVIIASLITCFLIMIYKKKFRVIELGITLLGIVYVPLLLSLFLTIYSLYRGPVLIWLVFLIAWAGDTAAYFTGLAIGKHRLCPAISPKKSVEGAVGGLIGSILGCLLFGLAAERWAGINFNPVSYMLLGFIGGILAQAGDLSASIIKRFAGVKDFGNIIPGHGGILDRFDSILFVLPVVYFYVRYFI